MSSTCKLVTAHNIHYIGNYITSSKTFMLRCICSNQTPCYQFLIRQILQCACLSCHTGRFDSKFSHISKSNTEYELLYYPMGVLLWLQFAFFKETKILSLLNFWYIWEVFSNSASWCQNLRRLHTSTLFYWC